MSLHQVYMVQRKSHVGHVRRTVSRVARSVAFSEDRVGQVALIATEMATNLVKHTPDGGKILARTITTSDNASDIGLELIALDQGPGIINPYLAMQDGVSTSGGLGGGLGAIQRLSDTFDLYSQPDLGTAILARIGAGGEAKSNPPLLQSINTGAVLVAFPGEIVCGDGWAIKPIGKDRVACLVVDGLGHGPKAAEAAKQALEIFQKPYWYSGEDTVNNIHLALKDTRGAALALATLHLKKRELYYIGVGNIAGRLITQEESKGLVSYGGIVGGQMSTVREFTMPWPKQSLLIMHSDGVQSRWDPTIYPDLIRHHPALVAAVLYRDFGRGIDDVSVLVIRSNL